MNTLNVGDIFEYHQFNDAPLLTFVAKDERMVILKYSTPNKLYYTVASDAVRHSVLTHPKFKKLSYDELSDNFKAYYLQEFSTLKRGSKVEFNYRGTLISGVVIDWCKVSKKVKAKFIFNSAILHITAEPYLFTEKY